jgi:hypothetical protein
MLYVMDQTRTGLHLAIYRMRSDRGKFQIIVTGNHVPGLGALFNAPLPVAPPDPSRRIFWVREAEPQRDAAAFDHKLSAAIPFISDHDEYALERRVSVKVKFLQLQHVIAIVLFGLQQ